MAFHSKYRGGSCGGSHRAILRHLTIRGRNQLTKHGHGGIAVVTVVIEPVKETNIMNVNNKPLLGYLGPIGSVVPGENSHSFGDPPSEGPEIPGRSLKRQSCPSMRTLSRKAV